MSNSANASPNEPSAVPIRVLLIDDDEDVLVLVSAFLEESGPTAYTLDRVATYEAGIEALTRANHDVCLLDFRLGAVNGIDLLREIMANGCTIPIIMLTAQGDAAVDADAMNLGAVDYVDKTKMGERLPGVSSLNTGNTLERSIRYAVSRARTQKALRESDQRYRDLFENTSDLIQSVRPDGTILYTNHAWMSTLGYTDEEVKQLAFPDIIHPDDLEHCMNLFQRILAGESINDIETRFVSKDGRTISVEGTTSCQFEEGVPVATRGIFRDVTQRKKAEAQLSDTLNQVQKSHDDMLSILNQLRLGVILTDPDGRVAFASRSCENLLGRPCEKVIGLHWADLLASEDSDNAQLRSLFETPHQPEKRVPIRIRSTKGRSFWTEVEVGNDPRVPGGNIILLYDMTEVHTLRRQLDEKAQFEDLIGKSEPMKLVYEQITQLARVDATVLVEGDTGTGKELVARALHYTSHRKKKPFIAVNCAGLTESLLGSQLFGHKKGAFTGAISDHRGVFEEAQEGSIFLDEIGDIPPTIQSSLLRVLQEKEITRLGESIPRKVDVRFIAATRRDLGQEVEKGTFRDDLSYRIRVAQIHLPALAERREDIPLLVTSFLEKSRASTGKSIDEVDTKTMGILMEHPWPGNVRELENAIESAVIRCQGTILRPKDLPSRILDQPKTQLEPQPRTIYRHQPDKAGLLSALEKTRGNHAAAARALGIGRSTLYRKLKKHGIRQAE
jgi:PAS domain S-box-containing protein